ncbi:HTH_Tnp_Tc3_2 domain-containing protein [Trichonephila clavipes]|nr:HTH_Tnp_Tc3_2 domain-containing protein [Trichonephila clavipes]
MNLTWRNPPAYHWYAAKSPGLSLQCRSSRALQTALARFRSCHLRGRWKMPRLEKQNLRQTVDQLTTQYDAGPITNVSERTVQRTRFERGLHRRRPTRWPLLTKRHCQSRLEWAQKH